MPKRRAGSSPVPGTSVLTLTAQSISVNRKNARFDFHWGVRRRIMAEIMAVLSLCLFPLRNGISDVFAIGDGVALEHLSGFPAANVHDSGLRNTRFAKFSRR